MGLGLLLLAREPWGPVSGGEASDGLLHCTMGPLQWEDYNRNFSFLKGIMTFSRQNVTFTF